MLALVITGYIVMIFIVAWVIEPYLRLRHNFLLSDDALIKDDLKFLVSVFWPIGLPVWFACKIILAAWKFIKYMEEKADQRWAPSIIPEKIVDESKSDYRNVSFTERK